MKNELNLKILKFISTPEIILSYDCIQFSIIIGIFLISFYQYKEKNHKEAYVDLCTVCQYFDEWIIQVVFLELLEVMVLQWWRAIPTLLRVYPRCEETHDCVPVF